MLSLASVKEKIVKKTNNSYMYIKLISDSIGIALQQVKNTIKLIEEGATVPFISRYRKEATGNLDEVKVAEIKELYIKYTELISRKETIVKTIEEQGAMTSELRAKIDDCWDSNALEDIYLPYKPKRKTRAVKARENGLEPLAKMLMRQNAFDVDAAAEAYITDNVPTTQDALQGARDIIAEWISEDSVARDIVRSSFEKRGRISSKMVKGKEEEGAKYKDYFEWEESLSRCPSHRLLAMRRAEREGIIKVTIAPEDNEVPIERLNRRYVKGHTPSAANVSMAVCDAYKRLIEPSIENEFSSLSKEKADTEAIKVFADNLRQLLLSAPLGQHRVMAIDPGFRTGCKVVCLDEQGALLYNTAIYPHAPQSDVSGATSDVRDMVKRYRIEAVAIGNGTASRETEQFVRDLKLEGVKIFVVSEDGASIYSASKIARDEFPDYDVTVRGAVSIGRRLIDPLAELVKIDPKSIGVGQYQHDVDQSRLRDALNATVESCVNSVGVNLNTASKHLLMYVSGLGETLAQNIVDYRMANGPFKSRAELKKVPRLGAKAYEQCAGFLRISGGSNPLDNSAVHPESYYIVKQMASDINCTVDDLVSRKELRTKIDLKRYVSDIVGLPTLNDIMTELEKPGRDPREAIVEFSFDKNVTSIEHLQTGMILPGIVSNITAFGAFVNIGVKQDGLIHISQMSDNRFVKDINDVLKLHQHVSVKVIDVDISRKRISLKLVNN